MNPDKKAVLMINGEEFNCGDFNIASIGDEDIKPFNSGISSGTITGTLKINRWNRFKLWWWFQKEKYRNNKTYEFTIKG